RSEGVGGAGPAGRVDGPGASFPLPPGSGRGPPEGWPDALAKRVAESEFQASGEPLVAEAPAVPAQRAMDVSWEHGPGEVRAPGAPHAETGRAWLRGGLESDLRGVGPEGQARRAGRGAPPDGRRASRRTQTSRPTLRCDPAVPGH